MPETVGAEPGLMPHHEDAKRLSPQTLPDCPRCQGERWKRA
jgi:hypothetical protein